MQLMDKCNIFMETTILIRGDLMIWKRSWNILDKKECIIVIICLVIIFYMNLLDSSSNTSLLQGILSLQRDDLLDNFAGSYIWQIYSVARTNEALLYFLPALLGIVTTKRFLDEWNSQYIIHILGRIDKRIYLSQMIQNTILISIGITLVSWILFCITASFLLIPLNEYEPSMQCVIYTALTGVNIQNIHDIQYSILFFNIFLSLAELLAFAAFVGLFDILIAAISRNLYITLCLPCYIFYILNLLHRRLWLINGKTWAKYLTPEILLEWDKNNLIGYIACLIVLYIISTTIFYYYMNKGVDKCNG